MTNDKNQGKQQQPQSDQSRSRIDVTTPKVEESVHYERSREGDAGDGTNNTGPRKTE